MTGLRISTLFLLTSTLLFTFSCLTSHTHAYPRSRQQRSWDNHLDNMIPDTDNTREKVYDDTPVLKPHKRVKKNMNNSDMAMPNKNKQVEASIMKESSSMNQEMKADSKSMRSDSMSVTVGDDQKISSESISANAASSTSKMEDKSESIKEEKSTIYAKEATASESQLKQVQNEGMSDIKQDQKSENPEGKSISETDKNSSSLNNGSTQSEQTEKPHKTQPRARGTAAPKAKSSMTSSRDSSKNYMDSGSMKKEDKLSDSSTPSQDSSKNNMGSASMKNEDKLSDSSSTASQDSSKNNMDSGSMKNEDKLSDSSSTASQDSSKNNMDSDSMKNKDKPSDSNSKRNSANENENNNEDSIAQKTDDAMQNSMTNDESNKEAIKSDSSPRSADDSQESDRNSKMINETPSLSKMMKEKSSDTSGKSSALTSNLTSDQMSEATSNIDSENSTSSTATLDAESKNINDVSETADGISEPRASSMDHYLSQFQARGQDSDHLCVIPCSPMAYRYITQRQYPNHFHYHTDYHTDNYKLGQNDFIPSIIGTQLGSTLGGSASIVHPSIVGNPLVSFPLSNPETAAALGTGISQAVSAGTQIPYGISADLLAEILSGYMGYPLEYNQHHHDGDSKIISTGPIVFPSDYHEHEHESDSKVIATAPFIFPSPPNFKEPVYVDTVSNSPIHYQHDLLLLKPPKIHLPKLPLPLPAPVPVIKPVPVPSPGSPIIIDNKLVADVHHGCTKLGSIC